jgi:ABC-type Na+ efflux pump permease subunit
MLEFLLMPGLWLMRRLSTGGKLFVLLVISVGVLAALVVTQAFMAPVGAMLTGVAVLAGLLSIYLGVAFYVAVSSDLKQVQQAMDHLVQGNLRFKPVVQGQDEYTALLTALGALAPAFHQWWPTCAAMLLL